MCMHPAGGLGPGTPLGGRRGSFRSLGSLAVVQIAERLLRPMREASSVGFGPSRSVAPSGGNARIDASWASPLPTRDQIRAFRLSRVEESSVSLHRLAPL